MKNSGDATGAYTTMEDATDGHATDGDATGGDATVDEAAATGKESGATGDQILRVLSFHQIPQNKEQLLVVSGTSPAFCAPFRLLTFPPPAGG